MSEHSRPDGLSSAFAGLEADVRRRTRLPGLDDLYHTVGQRRRRRRAIVAAIVVLVLIPAAIIALLRAPGRPPDIGPSPTSPMRQRIVPPGDLGEGLVMIPPFTNDRCPSGPVQLGARQPDGVIIDAHVTAAGDVNGDGVVDLVTRLDCLDGQAFTSQVVVYTKDPAGALTVLSVVVSAANQYYWSDVEPDGSIRLTVSEAVDPPPAPLRVTWQTYRFDGTGFSAVGEPAAVPPNGTTQLSVTATAVGSERVSVLTVTVHNGGTVDAGALAVQLTFRADREVVIRFGTSAATPLRGACGPGTSCSWPMYIEPVPDHSSVVGTFVVELPDPLRSIDLTLTVKEDTVRSGEVPNVDGANETTIPLKVT